ncbi:MAG: serine hydrolase domain-containing protein [Chloroflexota bacterium]
MRKFLLILLSGLSAALLISGALAVYLDLHLYLRPIPADFDAAVRQQMEAAKLPGVALGVIEDNQLVFAKGYGEANIAEGRPVTPVTTFQIASVSKLVTGAALMRLYDQGKFGLDDDIDAYLPFSVRNPRYPAIPITFRMLLAHTSSIADGPSYNATYTLGKSEDSPIALGEYLLEYFTPAGKYYDIRKNFTRNQPGSAYEYSNTGFALVGYLIEQITGMPFDRFCEQEVFTPLGMASTHWLYRDVDEAHWAMPYRYDVLQRGYLPLGAYSFATYPDGALKTSINDFARFLIPFTNGGKTAGGEIFLQAATVAEMLRVQYPQSGEMTGLAWHVDVEGVQFQHTGSDPGITTMVVLKPAERLALITFTNGGGAESVGGMRSTFGFLQFVKNITPRLVKAARSQ